MFTAAIAGIAAAKGISSIISSRAAADAKERQARLLRAAAEEVKKKLTVNLRITRQEYNTVKGKQTTTLSANKRALTGSAFDILQQNRFDMYNQFEVLREDAQAKINELYGQASAYSEGASRERTAGYISGLTSAFASAYHLSVL